MTARKAEEYAQRLCDVLWDEKQTLTQFRDCIAQLKAKLESFTGDHHLADRLRIFTSHLLPSQKQRPRGRVTFWHMDRGFGFVGVEDGQEIYVNWRAIRETVHKYLREGEYVEFDVVKTELGPQARDLRILPKGSS